MYLHIFWRWRIFGFHFSDLLNFVQNVFNFLSAKLSAVRRISREQAVVAFQTFGRSCDIILGLVSHTRLRVVSSKTAKTRSPLCSSTYEGSGGSALRPETDERLARLGLQAARRPLRPDGALLRAERGLVRTRGVCSVKIETKMPKSILWKLNDV